MIGLRNERVIIYSGPIQAVNRTSSTKATIMPIIVTNAGDYTEVKVNNDAADGQTLIQLIK